MSWQDPRRRTHERILHIGDLCQDQPDLLQEYLCRSCASMFQVSNLRRATARAMLKTAEGSLSKFKFTPCRNESGPTPMSAERHEPHKLKPAEGSRRDVPPTVRREFTCDVQHPRRATARTIRPAQTSAERSLLMFQIRAAPWQQRSDPPKDCRGLICDVHNSHRSTTPLQKNQTQPTS